MALVRERTIPTERPPPVGEVSANVCGKRGVTWSAQRVPMAVNLFFLDRSRYLFYSSSSSIYLTRLSGPRSKPTTTLCKHKEVEIYSNQSPHGDARYRFLNATSCVVVDITYLL
jgi:hypothetical protein